MRKGLLASSLGLNLLLVAIGVKYVWQFREDIIQHFIIRSGKANIVMLGDSHSAYGNWSELLSRLDIANMGVPGYTSEQIKILASTVGNLHPQYCFVLVGTNDIISSCCPISRTLSNYQTIAEIIRKQNVTPVFQTIFYRLNDPAFNVRVDSINAGLASYCSVQHIDLIDLNKFFRVDYNFRPDVQRDGLHLNQKGYQIWAGQSKRYLAVHGAN